MNSKPELDDVRLISSMATRETLNELIRLFSQQSHWKIKAESGGGVDVTKRVQAGEPVDLVVLASASIDQLIADGKLLAEIYRTGNVLSQRTDDGQIVLRARVDEQLAGRLARSGAIIAYPQ